jgi:hypothetical protein
MRRVTCPTMTSFTSLHRVLGTLLDASHWGPKSWSPNTPGAAAQQLFRQTSLPPIPAKDSVSETGPGINQQMFHKKSGHCDISSVFEGASVPERDCDEFVRSFKATGLNGISNRMQGWPATSAIIWVGNAVQHRMVVAGNCDWEQQDYNNQTFSSLPLSFGLSACCQPITAFSHKSTSSDICQSSSGMEVSVFPMSDVLHILQSNQNSP